MNRTFLTLVLSLLVLPASWAVEATYSLVSEKGQAIKPCDIYTSLTLGGTENGIAGVHARLENKMRKSVNAFCPQVEVEADLRSYDGLLVRKGANNVTTYTGKKSGNSISIVVGAKNEVLVKEVRGTVETIFYSAQEGEAGPEAKKLDEETLKVLDLVVTHCASIYQKTKGKNELSGGTLVSKVEKSGDGVTTIKTYVLNFVEINFPKASTPARHALEVVESVFQPKGLRDNRGPATVECREIKVQN